MVFELNLKVKVAISSKISFNLIRKLKKNAFLK